MSQKEGVGIDPRRREKVGSEQPQGLPPTEHLNSLSLSWEHRGLKAEREKWRFKLDLCSVEQISDLDRLLAPLLSKRQTFRQSFSLV